MPPDLSRSDSVAEVPTMAATNENASRAVVRASSSSAGRQRHAVLSGGTPATLDLAVLIRLGAAEQLHRAIELSSPNLEVRDAMSDVALKSRPNRCKFRP